MVDNKFLGLLFTVQVWYIQSLFAFTCLLANVKIYQAKDLKVAWPLCKDWHVNQFYHLSESTLPFCQLYIVQVNHYIAKHLKLLKLCYNAVFFTFLLQEPWDIAIQLSKPSMSQVCM